LIATARPLPRMLNFVFFEPLPSLVIAYRLYDDASRCDEVREENKIVHPAFCPQAGQALSN
jgi:prophage DNA circulation protein